MASDGAGGKSASIAFGYAWVLLYAIGIIWAMTPCKCKKRLRQMSGREETSNNPSITVTADNGVESSSRENGNSPVAAKRNVATTSKGNKSKNSSGHSEVRGRFLQASPLETSAEQDISRRSSGLTDDWSEDEREQSRCVENSVIQ